MRHPLPVIASLAVLISTCVACSGLGRVDPLRVVTSGRDGWQHPEQVVEALDLEPGAIVADVGAGDGYFLPWLSRAVGPDGRVYAVEVEDALVEALEARVEADALANVVVVRGDYEDPKLPDGRIDLVFTCNTYHHIEHRSIYFDALRADLAPGGRVAHLDERDDVTGLLRLFQTRGHWTNPDVMDGEMESAHYRLVERLDFLPTQSFGIFAPAVREAPGAQASTGSTAAKIQASQPASTRATTR